MIVTLISIWKWFYIERICDNCNVISYRFLSNKRYIDCSWYEKAYCFQCRSEIIHER